MSEAESGLSPHLGQSIRAFGDEIFQVCRFR